MTTTIPAIQTAIISDAQAQSSITSLLPSASEIRELEWQGDAFDYPNVRVSVILHPARCGPDRAEIFFDIFSDEKSSLLAQNIAAAIQAVYHNRTFNVNGLHFSMSAVTQVGKSDRTIFDWTIPLRLEVLVA